MRFKLTLSIDKHAFGTRIPLNYQYECSAAIYKILANADKDFSEWLHQNGFKTESGKRFKLFTFSRLNVPKYRIEKEFLNIQSDTVEWQISFLPERSTQEFIQGLFQNQTLEIGTREANVRFSVRNVEVMPPPQLKESMNYESLSPICIALKRDNQQDLYIAPDHPEAARLIKQNLLEKYRAMHRQEFPLTDFPFGINVLNRPKSSLITIKANTPQQTQIRGFMCKFNLTAPEELQKILYETGCGSKNSTGFGMVSTI